MDRRSNRARRATLQSGRDDPPTTLAERIEPDGSGVSDYERHVELAAKGMAERDSRPMPTFVTTPEAFYKVMAGAALEAIDLRALLDRLTREEH